MDEQQIIDNIIEELYGYDIFMQNEDTNELNVVQRKKQEKYDEFVLQINSICLRLEKELKELLGEEAHGLSKLVRGNVLKTIQQEVSNGNKIVNSDGKIDTGKITEIISKQKNEILTSISTEKDEPNKVVTEINNINENREMDGNRSFEKTIDSLGVNLSEEAKDRLKGMVDNGERTIERFKEMISQGVNPDEAIRTITSGMTSKQIREVLNEIYAASIINNVGVNNFQNSEQENETIDKENEGENLLGTLQPDKLEKKEFDPQIDSGVVFAEKDPKKIGKRTYADKVMAKGIEILATQEGTLTPSEQATIKNAMNFFSENEREFIKKMEEQYVTKRAIEESRGQTFETEDGLYSSPMLKIKDDEIEGMFLESQDEIFISSDFQKENGEGTILIETINTGSEMSDVRELMQETTNDVVLGSGNVIFEKSDLSALIGLKMVTSSEVHKEHELIEQAKAQESEQDREDDSQTK